MLVQCEERFCSTSSLFVLQSSDVHRTIPINCGYIGTNDYDIETGDREFMLRVSLCNTPANMMSHGRNLRKLIFHLRNTVFGRLMGGIHISCAANLSQNQVAQFRLSLSFRTAMSFCSVLSLCSVVSLAARLRVHQEVSHRVHGAV